MKQLWWKQRKSWNPLWSCASGLQRASILIFLSNPGKYWNLQQKRLQLLLFVLSIFSECRFAESNMNLPVGLPLLCMVSAKNVKIKSNYHATSHENISYLSKKNSVALELVWRRWDAADSSRQYICEKSASGECLRLHALELSVCTRLRKISSNIVAALRAELVLAELSTLFSWRRSLSCSGNSNIRLFAKKLYSQIDTVCDPFVVWECEGCQNAIPLSRKFAKTLPRKDWVRHELNGFHPICAL